MVDEGGDAACWLQRVCEECGMLVEPGREHRCVRAARLDHIDPGAGPDGVVWSLGGQRDMEVNLVVLGAGSVIGEHLNRAVDVVIVVLDGSAAVTVDGVARWVGVHDLLVVPKGARRALAAGVGGVRYASIHVARPGPTVERR